MILIEDLIYDRHKFCLNCNRKIDDVKALKFSVKDNDYGATTICLCSKCRAELKKIL